MWNERSAKILTDLISGLNNNGVKYFILRNYEMLPEHNESKDVDILIEPGSYKKAASVLLSVYKDNDIKNIHIVKYERVRCWYGMDISTDFSIHIDLIAGYLSKGFESFLFSQLFSNCISYNNMFVLNKEFDAVILLLYKIIMAKHLNERYQNTIYNAYQNAPDEIHKLFATTIGDRLASKVCKAIEDRDFESIESLSKEISYKTKWRAFTKRPFATAIHISEFFFEKFYRIIICPKKYQHFIAVLGADGTGKSTFIDGIVKSIGLYYVSDQSKCHVYHHRPTILPNLGVVGEKAKVMKQDTDFTNPHRGKPSGFISSLIRMKYYWLDYAIGVPTKLRKDVQFDRFAIYDRYIYDFLIDPLRSKINLPYWIRKVFTKLVIQPRIVFVLLADAQTIYQRKQELTIEEISRQLEEFEKLAKTHNRFVIIDANQPPDKMVEDATKIILDTFTRKI